MRHPIKTTLWNTVISAIRQFSLTGQTTHYYISMLEIMPETSNNSILLLANLVFEQFGLFLTYLTFPLSPGRHRYLKPPDHISYEHGMSGNRVTHLLFLFVELI